MDGVCPRGESYPGEDVRCAAALDVLEALRRGVGRWTASQDQRVDRSAVRARQGVTNVGCCCDGAELHRLGQGDRARLVDLVGVCRVTAQTVARRSSERDRTTETGKSNVE